MTKSGLIQTIAARMPHLSVRDVEVVVNTMFESMTHALERNDRIEIRGFGSFSVRHRTSRMGRNPKTGDAIAVPAKRVPFFTVGHDLRKRVDNGRHGDSADTTAAAAVHADGDVASTAVGDVTSA